MATHYARQKGIPACGQDVVDNRVQRQSKWKTSGTRPMGKRTVTVQHITSKTRTDVDCVDCEPFMDADGLP
jgi:hypothetical protein